MPVMGGIEATGLIREFEDQENIPRTPIVALTAHAMIGEQLYLFMKLKNR